MVTNTRKCIRKSDSEVNPEPSSMVPKKGKMNKKLSKREREEIAHSLKCASHDVIHSLVLVLSTYCNFLFSVVLSLDST